MKRYLLSLCLIGAVCLVQAQKKKEDLRLMERTYKVTRIPLREKFNLPARDLPVNLIKAYCEGNIVGYYPMKPDVVCSYHEFASHFGVNKVQPPNEGDAFAEVNCPQAFCYTKNEATIEPFRLFVDVFETKTFGRESSTEVSTVKYIRLNYVVERHGMEIVLDGPLFMYSDIIKLDPALYSLPNPKNDAARIGLKQFFEKRMFTGTELKEVGTQLNDKEKGKETEKDKWHH